MRNLKGDVFGGFSAAILTLPMSIGYGILAFAPLGIEFASKAALLGVYSAVLGGIVAGVFGGTPIQISGPKAPLTLVIGTFVAGTSAKLMHSIPSITPEMIIGLAGVCIMIAGICQLIFGLLGVGNLVKYVPQPVVAGFINGIALLLIVKQIRPILGIEPTVAIIDVFSSPEVINLPVAIVGITTIISIIIAKRYLKKVPSSLVALGIGSAIFYLLKMSIGSNFSGEVIGQFNIGVPSPEVFMLWTLDLGSASYKILLQYLLLTGVILGLLASMDSLLASVVSDNLTGSRHNSRKELIGQGLGNVSCGIFGALPVAGSVPRSLVNYQNGGRTRLSGIICSLLMLLIIIFLAPVVSKIPIAVIAAIILIVGVSLVDNWSINVAKQLVDSGKIHSETFFDVFIMLVVAIVTVSINLVAAVAIGIGIASAMFISRSGRSIIKRKYLGSNFHSRKLRNLEQSSLLEKHGDKILIIELHGPLFFGSAENLAIEIERSMATTHYCILDFRNINDIDSTGASILLRIKNKLEKQQKFLLVSHLSENQLLGKLLKRIHEHEFFDKRYVFVNIDSALEWAEDDLLSGIAPHTENAHISSLHQIELFRNFTETEIDIINSKLTSCMYAKDELVLKEGASDRDLYVLIKGSISIKLHLVEKNHQTRIFTFSAGVPFGEVSFLDESPRSADVWANEESEALCLRYDRFLQLREQHPEIATKLVTNLSIELSRRLRRTSDQLRILEDS